MVFIPLKILKCYFFSDIGSFEISYSLQMFINTFCLNMTPKIITLSLLIPSKQGRINSGTGLGTGYGGTVCGFHTRLWGLTIMRQEESRSVKKRQEVSRSDKNLFLLIIHYISYLITYIWYN